MARKPLTEAQIKARTAKAKATREAKKKAALELMGVETKPAKKARKSRKLTEGQKKAAAERLAKARQAKGPSKNSQVAENVRKLADDNLFSVKNVRRWIKENKELLAAIKSFKDSKDSKEREQYLKVETYIANLESYLRNGVYLDMFYGAQMQHKISHKVYVMAYNKDGSPKRTVGWYYPDVGLYTQEMADEDNGRKQISNESKVRKTSRGHRARA